MDLSTSEKRRVKAGTEWIKVFQETNSVTITARKCGVPRSTIYRWIDKYKHNGEIGLVGQSRRPHSFGNLKVTPSIEKTILEIREKYKWGPQRIKNYLDRLNNCTISSSTI